MKLFRHLVCGLMVPFAVAGAADKPALHLDPKRIINDSAGFLLQREPEMNAEEYALYEKVVTMLGTKPEFALKLLEAMMNDQEKPSPAFRFILGNAYYAAGQNDKAEASYRDAVERYPTFLRAWNNLGVLYYSTLRYAEATPCFSRSVALGDREPTTFGLLGYCLEQRKSVVPAEMAYMQALAGDPTNADWMEGLLRIYVEGRQYGRAEWLVKDLIRQRPHETHYWFSYANILLAQGRRLEATAVLETCASAGAAGAEELNMLADLYAEQKLVPEAIAAYRRLAGSSADLGEKRLLKLAQMLVASRDLEGAAQVLKDLRDTVSAANRIEYLQTRVDLLAAKKSWAEARAEIDRLLALAPLNGRALLSLGQARLAEDDYARARFAFEAALQDNSATYRASLSLANIAVHEKHYDEAVQHLEKALGIEKSPALQDYLARVRPLTGKKGETDL